MLITFKNYIPRGFPWFPSGSSESRCQQEMDSDAFACKGLDRAKLRTRSQPERYYRYPSGSGETVSGVLIERLIADIVAP